MLHALGTDLSHWGDVLRQLPEDVPVLACDLAGHGASPRGAASVEAHADDVALPTEHHDLHEAIVCGVSLGGIVAQALAASRGGVVARMILICTGQRIGSAVIWQERRRAILSIGLPGTAPDIVEQWG